MRTVEEILAYAIRQYRSARNLHAQAATDFERQTWYCQLIPLAHLIRYAQGDHDGDTPIDVLNIPLSPDSPGNAQAIPEYRIVEDSFGQGDDISKLNRVAGVGVKKAMGIKG